MILLDTHVVAWLHAGEAGRLPANVLAEIDGSDAIGTSAVSELELQYLHEIGRLTEPAQAVLAALERSIGLERVDASLGEVVERALEMAWTRDPFDRLIAAHASSLGAPLATADASMRANVPVAFWD